MKMAPSSLPCANATKSLRSILFFWGEESNCIDEVDERKYCKSGESEIANVNV